MIAALIAATTALAATGSHDPPSESQAAYAARTDGYASTGTTTGEMPSVGSAVGGSDETVGRVTHGGAIR